MTALHFACQNGNVEIVRLLLSKKNIDVNLPSEGNYHKRAIHFACQYYEIIKLLCQYPGIDINALTSDGWSVLQMAFQMGYEQTALFIIGTGKFDVTKPFNNGDFPLHLAAKSGSEEVVKELLKYKNIDLNAKNNVYLILILK